MALPALVNQAVDSAGSVASKAVTIPATASGNGLVVRVGIASSSVVVSSLSGVGGSWTKVPAVAPDLDKDGVVNDHEVWYNRTPTAGSTSVTVTLSAAPSGGFTIHVSEWSNLGPHHTAGYDNWGALTSITSGVVYPRRKPCIVLAYMEWRGTEAVTLNSPQGFTALTNMPAGGTANISGRAAYKIADYGPQMARWTSPTNISGGGQIVAFEAGDAVGQSIMFKADHEESDLLQYEAPEEGGAFTAGGGPELSGPGTPTIVNSTDWAKNGTKSMKIQIDGDAGARMFRTKEIRDDAVGLYYSGWFYVPQMYAMSGVQEFWNFFQFKSENEDGSINDNTWTLYLRRRTHPNAGNLWARLEWAGGDMGLAGPLSTDGVANQAYAQDVTKDIAIATPVHFEVFLKQSTGFTGRITVWQDGVQVYDINNVKTGFSHTGFPSGMKMGWSVNAYSDGITPNPAYIYADDLVISTARIGTGEVPATPVMIRSRRA